MPAAYPQFHLCLLLTHRCNLACSYCYAGQSHEGKPVLSREMARRAVTNALNSLAPGGTLNISFFGGEPLLEAKRLAEIRQDAKDEAERRNLEVTFQITTNGTVGTPEAWTLLLDAGIGIAISLDGSQAAHDRHRIDRQGKGSHATVVSTIKRLAVAGRDFSAIMVVRPDTLALMPEGIRNLQRLGVPFILPMLDLWAEWQDPDIGLLEALIPEIADAWVKGLPTTSISWFDDKLHALSGVAAGCRHHCGFGHGELAATTSGHLYPCERLVGPDDAGNRWRIPGQVADYNDFLALAWPTYDRCGTCAGCQGSFACRTECKCANLIRTGNPSEPDGLLCRFEKRLMQATEDVALQVLEKTIPFHQQKGKEAHHEHTA